MKLRVQKRLAAQVLGVSEKKIKFDVTKLEEIKEAITKVDIRGLIGRGVIQADPIRGISRGRIRKTKNQKSKGKRRGFGSRKGKFGARNPRKVEWIKKIRLQRRFIKELKNKEMISTKTYHDLYKLSKSGFFRNKRHIKVYLEDHNLIIKKK